MSALYAFLWACRLFIVALAASISIVRKPTAFRDHYYCGTDCRPPRSLTWEKTGERARFVWLRLAWRRVDHVFFLAWWHWHFVAGIRWYQVFANLIAEVMSDEPIVVRRRSVDVGGPVYGDARGRSDLVVGGDVRGDAKADGVGAVG